MKYLIALLLLSAATIAHTQIFKCTGPGIGTIAGTPIAYDCGEVPPPTPPSGCDPTTVSTTFKNGSTLTRACAGSIYWGPYRPSSPAGTPWVTLDAVFNGTWTTSYVNNNAPFAPSIPAGKFMALQFTPTVSATFVTLVMNYMGSYGTSGVVSYSRTPGNFTPSDSTCVVSTSNNLLGYTGPKYPGYCSIAPDGSPYYVNFAPVLPDGTPTSYKGVFNPVVLNYYLTKQ